MTEVSCLVASGGLSITLPLLLCGVETSFVIDTGASVTIVSTDTFNRIPAARRPRIQKPDKMLKLEVADSGLLPVDGIVKLSFEVGGYAYIWDMYVADIPGDGLLGLDFLFHHNYTLNKEGLLLDGHLVRCELEGESMLCAARVTLQEDVVVPATSQCVAPGEADVTAFRSQYGVIEPIPGESKLGAMVGSTFVDPCEGNGLPVRLLNPSAENVKLRKGTTIGYLHQIRDYITIQEDESKGGDAAINRVSVGASNVKAHDVSTWPQPLQELYANSTGRLHKKQQSQLRAVLGRHTDLFAKSPDDLGRTNVVQHAIDTGDARPIKQNPRRPP